MKIAIFAILLAMCIGLSHQWFAHGRGFGGFGYRPYGGFGRFGYRPFYGYGYGYRPFYGYGYPYYGFGYGRMFF